MSNRRDSRANSTMTMQKMYGLDQAYRDINTRDQEAAKYRKMSNDLRNDQAREQDSNKELLRLEYIISRQEQKLKTARQETENAKRDLKNEAEGRKVVDKKLASSVKEAKDLRTQLGSLRVKFGLVNANLNVCKKETDELKKNNQENQIAIARLEERLTAANKEIERLRDPMNPHGHEEVRKKITFDKQELKRLKAEVQSLQELRAVDFERITDKETKNIDMHREMKNLKDTVFKLESQLEMTEADLMKERTTRDEFQRENQELRHAKETFDETIRLYKVRLGVSEAGKNVNVRQADVLRQKDKDYQSIIENLEKRLRIANVEIEKLKAQNMTDKTADSVQQYQGRLKKHRGSFGMEHLVPSSLSSPGRISSGWTPGVTPQRSPQRSPNQSPQRSPVRTPKGNFTRQRISVHDLKSVTANRNGANDGASTNRSAAKKSGGSQTSTSGSRSRSPIKTNRTADTIS